MWVIILMFVTGFLYYVYQYYRTSSLPPYYDGVLPIFGHSLYFLVTKNYFTLITNCLNKLLERKCELIRIRLGIWDLNVIINPEDAYLIANSSLEKDTLYDLLKPYLGNGLITAPASTWKIHRKLLNPTFNQQVLDGYLHEFNIQTRYLLDAVAVHAEKIPFYHCDIMLQTTLQMICTTALGSTIDTEEKHTREMFLGAMEEFMSVFTERLAKFWLHSDLIYNLTGRQMQLDVLSNKMKILTQKILDKKRAEYKMNQNLNDQNKGKTFKPFIELLLELSEEGLFTDEEISDELNTFIAAGTDTMGITLSNALTCIGSDDDVQGRIMKELEEIFNGSDRDVEKRDLPQMKYLEAVIKETLRLYPPVPIIARILDKEIQIQGYTLPAGSKCLFGVYGIQRHWSWGPDAHRFRPERWTDGSLPDNLKGFAAFGIGKRSCIGYNYSIIGLKTILSSFLRRYSIKSDLMNMVHEFYITAKPILGNEISIRNRIK